jgi:hypothetical protein
MIIAQTLTNHAGDRKKFMTMILLLMDDEDKMKILLCELY